MFPSPPTQGKPWQFFSLLLLCLMPFLLEACSMSPPPDKKTPPLPHAAPLWEHPFLQESRRLLDALHPQVKQRLQAPFQALWQTPAAPDAQEQVYTILIPPKQLQQWRQDSKSSPQHATTDFNPQQGASELTTRQSHPLVQHFIVKPTAPLTLGEWFQWQVAWHHLPLPKISYSHSLQGLNPAAPSTQAWLALREKGFVDVSFKPTSSQLNRPLTRLEVVQWLQRFQHKQRLHQHIEAGEHTDALIAVWQSPLADPDALLYYAQDWQQYSLEEQDSLLLAYQSGWLEEGFQLAFRDAASVKRAKLSMRERCSQSQAYGLLRFATALPESALQPQRF